MKRIYLIGSQEQKEALSSWFPTAIDHWSENLDRNQVPNSDVILALAPLSAEDFCFLCSFAQEKILFVEAVITSLTEQIRQVQGEVCPIFGINGHPFFLGKPPLEVSYLVEAERLEAWLKAIGVDYVILKDQVGMVRPRVLSMILNEAYWMLTEGQANPKDIDTALKLGVNYPLGPFEWANLLDESYIVQVLQKLGENLGNETYKIAPELRKKAILKNIYAMEN